MSAKTKASKLKFFAQRNSNGTLTHYSAFCPFTHDVYDVFLRERALGLYQQMNDVATGIEFKVDRNRVLHHYEAYPKTEPFTEEFHEEELQKKLAEWLKSFANIFSTAEIY